MQAAQCSVCSVCSVVRRAQVLRYGASVVVHSAQRGMYGVVHAGGEVHFRISGVCDVVAGCGSAPVM